MPNVNLIAVLVATVARMVVGFVWYMPQLFGNQMVALSGMTDAEMQKNMRPSMVVWLIVSLVIAFVLAMLVSMMPPVGIVNGMISGVVASVGFALTTSAAEYAMFGKPLKLYLISAGYNLVSFVVMGAILGVMG